MSDDSTVIVTSGLQRFFRDQLSDATQILGVNLQEAIEFYLVNLLCDYSHTATRRAPGDEPLALLYKKAIEAELVDSIPLYKDLGDTSLYVSGFFGESIARSMVDVDYYISMGGTAYASLGNLVSTYRRSQAMAELYFQLAENFGEIVAVLNQIAALSSGHNKSDAELVKLYSNWLRTKNPRIHKILLEKGLVTAFDPPDENLQ